MRLALLGVGLIGGSVGLAARSRLGAQVAGYDPTAAALEQALELGAIDRACSSVAEALAGADTVVVAAPVDALEELIGEALAHAEPGCVVTDVGSTKRGLVAAYDDPRYVGGHPLAGAETSGVAYARADLFLDAVWYLTPTARTEGVLYERLHRAIAGLGARPVALDAATHDRLMAGVSHLPHVLANVLVAHAARALGGSTQSSLPATGPSFRDATRVAGSNSDVWTGIYISNRDAISAAIADAIERLEGVRDALDSGDCDAVRRWNDQARADRRRLLETDVAGGPVHHLRVPVPNRPGVIAELALALGGAGVNIVDMGLYPAPDRSEGLVALWIAGDESADRAQELLAALGWAVARA